MCSLYLRHHLFLLHQQLKCLIPLDQALLLLALLLMVGQVPVLILTEAAAR